MPTTAPYGAKQVLDLGDVVVNGGTIAAVDDDAVQVAAYAGDVDGGTTINSVDSLFILQYVTNVRDGFTAYPTADPAILGDVDGGGSINSVDSLFVLQYVTNVDPGLSRVPPRPSGLAPSSGGPDPKLSLPRDLSAAPGESFTVPLTLEQTDPTTIALTSFDAGDRLRSVGLHGLGSASGRVVGRFHAVASGRRRDGGGGSDSRPAVDAPVAGSGDGRDAGGAGACGPVRRGRWRDVVEPAGGDADAEAPVFTGLNGGGLTLVPAPTNAADDPVDGVVTIERAVDALVEPTYGAPFRRDLRMRHAAMGLDGVQVGLPEPVVPFAATTRRQNPRRRR